MNAPTEPEFTNRLALETSPYLLQHAHNPVNWLPWGQEAFDAAREQDKPILLSIGYATCHWCHVMAHESFENSSIAEIMNRYFICVKVDREERPDVDRIYMAAVQAMTGAGGWPMTVFLEPGGKPFYAGTYFPPQDGPGRPGFPRLLEAVSDAWSNKREELEHSAAALTTALQDVSARGGRAGELDPDLSARALSNLSARFDAVNGGFGDAPKFPAPTTLEFLLQHYSRTANEQALEMALFTLERMARGGIYDQLGGGFHRYSVDARWAVPHFEKMLYDNAQLVRVYLHALQIVRQRAGHESSSERTELLERVVRETLDYLLREMHSSEGGFYSAQDADSEGIEGKFFTWTPAEFREVLGEDAPDLLEHLGVTEAGNFLDPHHPEFGSRSVLHLPQFETLEGRSRENLDKLAWSKQRLFAAREGRVKPITDDKVLTSWNGLALAAFAEAARVLSEPHYLRVALENARFFQTRMQAPDGRLFHTYRQGQAKITGLLEDVALYGLGLLELYKACGDLTWLEWARELWTVALRDHWDDSSGAFFSSATGGETLIARMQEFFDAAVMSDNAAAALLGLWINRYFGDADALEHAQKVVLGSVGEMLRAASGFGGLWQGFELLLSQRTEIVLMGSLEERVPLERVVAGFYLPFTALAPALSTDSSLALLENRTGEGVAYVCRDMACELPTRAVRVLESLLEGIGQRP